MRDVWKAAFVFGMVLLVLAPITLSQEKVEPSSRQEQVSVPYPDTTDGLKMLLQDVLSAAKRGDKEKVAAFVKDMEIPNYEAWFHKMFPADSAESWIAPYEANLNRNDRSMQKLLAQLAQREGELFTRKVNDNPEPGKGLEWGMLQSLKQPVDIYFASWKKPSDPKNSRGDPIGYFMFIDEKFRWDSTVSFGGSSMAAIGEQSAEEEAASSAPQPPVPEQILPGRVRLAQGASQAMIISRVHAQYPKEAMAKGIQGKVNMLAIISKTGEVADLRLIDGDPLLARAAIDAVKQWKYRPYLLQGNPVEVETKITYNFTIAGKN